MPFTAAICSNLDSAIKGLKIVFSNYVHKYLRQPHDNVMTQNIITTFKGSRGQINTIRDQAKSHRPRVHCLLFKGLSASWHVKFLPSPPSLPSRPPTRYLASRAAVARLELLILVWRRPGLCLHLLSDTKGLGYFLLPRKYQIYRNIFQSRSRSSRHWYASVFFY